MRDNIKSEDYFKKYLEYEYSRIEKFEKAVEKVIQERGAADRGVQSGQRGLKNFYFNVLKALYSSGASIESIKDFYPKVLNSMKPIWNSDSGYVEMVWMISIGIMMDIPDEEMRELVKMVKDDGLKDYLADFLLAHNNKDWERRAAQFKFDIPYKSLSHVINASSEEESLKNLKEYLVKKWYRGHKDTGWHDTHKSKFDIYSGYWSFESGALVKILKLDDSSLKDFPYYPYDMVHNQEKFI